MKPSKFLGAFLVTALVSVATSMTTFIAPSRALASSPAAEYTFTDALYVNEGFLRDGENSVARTLTAQMARSCAQNLGELSAETQCYKKMLNDGIVRNQFIIECKATCEVTRPGLLEITRHQVMKTSDENTCDIDVSLKLSLASDPTRFQEPAKKYATEVCGRSGNSGPSRVDGFECAFINSNERTANESLSADMSFKCMYSESRARAVENQRVAEKQAADAKVEEARAVLADLKLKIQRCSANLYDLEKEQMQKKLGSFSWIPSELVSPSAKVVSHMTGVSDYCKAEKPCRESLQYCQERLTRATAAQSNQSKNARN